MVLPLDAEDVQKHSRWKEFKRRSCPAVEQLAENACLVDVHLGVFSQKFIFPGSLGQFGPDAGGFADSSGDSESRLKFTSTVEPTR